MYVLINIQRLDLSPLRRTSIIGVANGRGGKGNHRVVRAENRSKLNDNTMLGLNSAVNATFSPLFPQQTDEEWGCAVWTNQGVISSKYRSLSRLVRRRFVAECDYEPPIRPSMRGRGHDDALLRRANIRGEANRVIG